MYSYGSPHMAEQEQDDQLKHTYSSYVRIQDVALKTYQRQWTIGRSGERGSKISVQVAWHDDDDVWFWYRSWFVIIEGVVSIFCIKLFWYFLTQTHSPFAYLWPVIFKYEMWRYPPLPPRYINFFEPFRFTAGDQLVVPIGASHISLPLQEIQSREQEKKEQTNNVLGVNSSAEGKLCNIVHM